MDEAHLTGRLQASFEYDSPPQRSFLAKAIPGWSTFIYYFRLIILIISSARVAKKGGYTDARWCRDAQLVTRFVELAGGRFHVGGIEGFAGSPGPFVFIANHMSMLDTFILPGIILPFQSVTFVIKEALLRYPVFGAIMRAVKPIAVERSNPRKDLKWVLEEGQRLLEKKRSIVIFPQATRSVRFDPAAFNSLGVKLARNAGVPVVPVALRTDFQQNGRLIREMGRVNRDKPVMMQFGTPMAVEGNGQITHQRIIEFIQEHLQAWGEQTPYLLEEHRSED